MKQIWKVFMYALNHYVRFLDKKMYDWEETVTRATEF